MRCHVDPQCLPNCHCHVRGAHQVMHSQRTKARKGKGLATCRQSAMPLETPSQDVGNKLVSNHQLLLPVAEAVTMQEIASYDSGIAVKQRGAGFSRKPPTSVPLSP